jgi:hypothetical protein
VERETALARKRVQDAVAAIMQKHEYLRNVENTRLTTTKPETAFDEMLDAIRDSLSDLSSSDNEENGADEDIEENTALGKLTEDDEPGWAMGTICKTVQHWMENVRQKLMRLDELRQPEWGDTANYFLE